MARRVPQFSIDEIQKAIQGPDVGKAISGGLNAYNDQRTLEETIADKQVARQRALQVIQAEIAKAKEEKAQKDKEQQFAQTLQGPVVATPGGQEIRAAETQALAPEFATGGTLAKAFPKETAESLLKSKLLAQSEEGKTERASMKKDQPGRADNVKSVFEVNGQPYMLKYSGTIEPFNVPGKAEPFVKPTLPAAESEKLGDFDTISKQLELVKTNKEAGSTGPIQGPLGKLKQKTGVGATSKRALFLGNLNSIRNALIYLRSGKQINENEYERLKAELPNEDSSDIDFDAKLGNFENVFNIIKANKRAAFSKGYSGVPEGQPEAPTGLPQVGEMFQGSKVKSIRRIQ